MKAVSTLKRVTFEDDQDFDRMIKRAKRAADRDVAERARAESIAKNERVRMLFWIRFSLP